MFARPGKLIVVVLLVQTTGLHWAALQTVAWATMLANNLRTHSLTEAVSDTFDGEHPCCMCKAIAAAKKAQKDSEAVAPVLKLEFPLLASKINLFPPTEFAWLPQIDFFPRSLSRKPPLPPPRLLLA